jgi:hypothetical protein
MQFLPANATHTLFASVFAAAPGESGIGTHDFLEKINRPHKEAKLSH